MKTEQPTQKDAPTAQNANWFKSQRAMLFALKKAATVRPKIIGLGIACMAVGALTWWLVERLLLSSSFIHAGSWWLLLGTFFSFFLWIALIGLVGVCVHDTIQELALLLAATLVYAVWFHFAVYAIVTMLILFLGMVYCVRSIRREEGERVRFSLPRVLERSQGLMIVTMLLAISITSYGVTAEKEKNAPVPPIERIGRFLGSSVNQALPLAIKGYHADETVDSFLLRMIILAGGGKGTSSLINTPLIIGDAAKKDFAELFQSLPASVQNIDLDQLISQDALKQASNAVLTQTVQQARTSFLETLKVPDMPTLTIGEVTEQAITNALVQRAGHYGSFVPPLFGVAVFILLSTLTFLYSFFIGLLANLVFWVARKTKFVHVRRAVASVEVVTLDRPAPSPQP